MMRTTLIHSTKMNSGTAKSGHFRSQDDAGHTSMLAVVEDAAKCPFL